jgi:hypothetical protein
MVVHCVLDVWAVESNNENRSSTRDLESTMTEWLISVHVHVHVHGMRLLGMTILLKEQDEAENENREQKQTLQYFRTFVTRTESD